MPPLAFSFSPSSKSLGRIWRLSSTSEVPCWMSWIWASLWLSKSFWTLCLDSTSSESMNFFEFTKFHLFPGSHWAAILQSSMTFAFSSYCSLTAGYWSVSSSVQKSPPFLSASPLRLGKAGKERSALQCVSITSNPARPFSGECGSPTLAIRCVAQASPA